MWDSRELKSKSKNSLKRNYGRTIAVCFIVAFLTAAFTTSTRLIDGYNPNNKISDNAIEVMGVQSTAYAVGTLFKDIRNNNPSSPKDLANQKNVVRVLDGLVNPNSATTNAIKITDHWLVKGFDVAIIFMLVGFILKLLYNIFISSALLIGSRRFMLENRVYKRTQIHKVFCLFWLRHIIHPAMVMLRRWIYQLLWWFTIGGGIYKRYEYIMIPYILAENPETPTDVAFEISKKMMNGHKWNTFKLELSFIGWHILDIFTAGLLNIFFVNGYKLGTFAELYMSLRNDAIENEKDYSVYFIDSYLEPTEDFINEHGDVYPYEHYMVSQKQFDEINPGRSYDLTSYILFFFIFSFIGWCFEVGMHLVGDGVFVNRGTMHGPWLPIFGSGGLFVLIFMRKYVDKPIFTFITITGVCTAIEYVISVYLEMKMGIRWWDYSEYFANFQGRICLYGALLFGFGGSAFLYFIGPLLDNQLRKLPQWFKIVSCIGLIVIFLADIYISIHNPNMGAGITDYKLN